MEFMSSFLTAVLRRHFTGKQWWSREISVVFSGLYLVLKSFSPSSNDFLGGLMSSCTVSIKVSSMMSPLKNPVWMQNRGSIKGQEKTIFSANKHCKKIQTPGKSSSL